MKIYRILGKDGTAAIPCALRQAQGFQPGDVVSFEWAGEGIHVKKERIEDAKPHLSEPNPLKAFLASLSAKDQYDALVHLSILWAQRQEEVRK